MQSGEENSSSGRFNPMGRLQQSGCLGRPYLRRVTPTLAFRNPYSIIHSSNTLQKGLRNSIFVFILLREHCVQWHSLINLSL